MGGRRRRRRECEWQDRQGTCVYEQWRADCVGGWRLIGLCVNRAKKTMVLSASILLPLSAFLLSFVCSTQTGHTHTCGTFL